MLGFVNYPSWIKPEVFAFLNLPPENFLNNIRWYALSYILALLISYYQCMYLLKKENFKTLNKKIFEDYFFWLILGLFLGARIFSALIYSFDYYSAHLWEILLPFREGQFVGFAGMSYHGGAIGIFTASVIYVKLKKINFRELSDLIFPAIPLGYTLGRIANFINQELWGRITASSFGILFPEADKAPLHLENTQKVINKLGLSVDTVSGIVTDKSGKIYTNLIGKLVLENGKESSITGINLPRHPSQLYEALFEGVILFFIMWFLGRRYKPFKGFLAPLYLIIYSIFRFFIEFLREPDNVFTDFSSEKFTGYIFANLSMGQILSILTALFGLALAFYFYYLDKKEKAL